jgi:hypothetical protein
MMWKTKENTRRTIERKTRAMEETKESNEERDVAINLKPKKDKRE